VPALLRAVARLRAEGRGVCLAVVGGRRLETWRRRIEWQGLGQAVTLVGPVADPVPYYAAADLYVHPTFYDACSLVALEAAACGLPVITSRYNGAAEVFGGSPGVRVIADPAHTEELAAAMRPLLDPAVRREMAAAARQTMLTHSLENNVDRILDVYQEVIERRRLSPPQGYGVWTARVPAAAEESAPAGQGRAPRPVASPPGVPA
jgi:UDP-glucose:(heptosyl)LPS alpha-1,3-glucosyltransferase